MSAITQKDFYKTDHRRQYPAGTTQVYSNLTARSDKLFKGSSMWDNKIVWFGLQRFIKEILMDKFNSEFFSVAKDKAVGDYKRRLDTALGPDAVPVDHIARLHDLGYLPIEIFALPEGSRVNMRIPVLTITNTIDDFFWLTNDLETILSTELWKPTTVATIAYEYNRLLKHFAEKTGSPLEFVQFQGHDFSMRGMSNHHDAANCGMGHLLSFTGTDTIPAIDAAERWYNAFAEQELIGTSVPATEHSVMCMGGKESEIETFRRLISDIYPTGIVSIVSDTWNFWDVLTVILPTLKDTILARPVNAIGLSKVVIRPDSGDPLKIICGDPDAEIGTPAHKGALQCLWETFGGTFTGTEHRLLDSHIGLIYGDSITIERAEAILQKMDRMGFASANIVFGIGSFTYQYVTRDTFGFAVKATYGEIEGHPVMLEKDPVTDSGIKKSARGMLVVHKQNGEYTLEDGLKWGEWVGKHSELRSVFLNGQLLIDEEFHTIRTRLGAL
jgi:nicotinamide phosphoribosyltransferase